MAVEPPLVCRWLHRRRQPRCLSQSRVAGVPCSGPKCNLQRSHQRSLSRQSRCTRKCLRRTVASSTCEVLVQLEWLWLMMWLKSLPNGDWANLGGAVRVHLAVVGAGNVSRSDMDPPKLGCRPDPANAVVSAKDHGSAGHPRSLVVATATTVSRIVRHLLSAGPCGPTPCTAATAPQRLKGCIRC